MPLGFRILAGILVPLFFLMAFHPRGVAAWSSIPFFQADGFGMYFIKLRDAYVVFKGRKSRDEWLFVPWENISNIRLARVSSHDGTSTAAAFDVKASKEEVAEFFYDDLVEKHPPQDGKVSVAFYLNTPPSPRKVVNDLLDLARRLDVYR